MGEQGSDGMTECRDAGAKGPTNNPFRLGAGCSAIKNNSKRESPKQDSHSRDPGTS